MSTLNEDASYGQHPSHPDSAIRMASSVHRFHLPEMGWGNNGPGTSVSFSRAFRTSGQCDETKLLMLQSDAARLDLAQALSAGSGRNKHTEVIRTSQEYLPLIHQVLSSCKAHPDGAILDERLLFEWSSGIEKAKSSKKEDRFSKSEALMYDLVMTIVCEGLGHVGMACDNCIEGKFANSSKSLKVAAGIFDFLATVQLPKWISKGTTVTEKELPIECNVGTCEALKELFLGIAQQMAVATVLVKPEKPNYKLVAKLCLGNCARFEEFTRTLRNKANGQMTRIDSSFYTLLTFQITLQKALSNYFQARAAWDDDEYGIAICMLNEASTLMRTRSSPTGKGIPDIDSKSSLRALISDISDFKKHISSLMQLWESDNSTIYFCKVPSSVPNNMVISQGTIMMKTIPFSLSEAKPLLLSAPLKSLSGASAPPPTAPGMNDNPPPPTTPHVDVGQPPPYSAIDNLSANREMSDRDLARELQAKINAGEDV